MPTPFRTVEFVKEKDSPTISLNRLLPLDEVEGILSPIYEDKTVKQLHSKYIFLPRRSGTDVHGLYLGQVAHEDYLPEIVIENGAYVLIFHKI